MKAIIFGIEGQDGYYLNSLLERNGVRVTGIGRKITEADIDISRIDDVRSLVRRVEPDYIFQLAANSTTSHEAVIENHLTIATGALNVLETVYRECKGCKVFLAGSGLQFVNKGIPIHETHEFELSSAYSLARNQSVMASRYYRQLGVQSYVGYFFNHDSPRRSERHVTQKIASAVRRIHEGSDEIIEIGDPTVKKEWGFAGDIVSAIWKLVNQDQVLECTIGTGKAYSIHEWIDECFRLVKLDARDYIRIKPGFKAEYEILVSDPTTIMNLGWNPQIAFEDLAKMMVENHG